MPEFRALLTEVVGALEDISGKEQEGWQEFLSYIYALVYHERSGSEMSRLHDAVEDAARSTQLKKEFRNMKTTYADILKAEGRKEGQKQGEILTSQEKLLRLLRARFETVSDDIVQRVSQTDDMVQLNTWFDQAATARTLAEVGIPG
jgi:ElaB/YqjD/DUF883 family membrane-anchored ribosome-binding protein